MNNKLIIFNPLDSFKFEINYKNIVNSSFNSAFSRCSVFDLFIISCLNNKSAYIYFDDMPLLPIAHIQSCIANPYPLLDFCIEVLQRPISVYQLIDLLEILLSEIRNY